ncbi:RCC1 domain-containing protein, partial [Archangium violaceum]|uniref:RCC1 domain-containing protein n=1 Tax=Archangium violaceum TaxID=83451 RepID=UPI0034E24EE8
MQSNAVQWMRGLLGVWLGVLCGVGCGPSTHSKEAQDSLGALPLATQARARLAAGGDHSLVVRPDGTVWAAGRNSFGQLGDGSTSSRPWPVQVQGLSGVVAVAAGYGHSLAVRSDGTVWSWGYNSEGQLGDGTTNNRTTPVQVSGLSGVVSVAAGRFHALAVRSDGSVWAWG